MEHFFHNFLPIPQIELFPNRIWVRITGITQYEKALENELKIREIPYYLPKEHHRKIDGKMCSGKLLFPENIFAAIKNRQEIAWFEEFFPEYQLYIPQTNQEQSELHADLRFMKFAERLSGEHRFIKGAKKSKSKHAIELHDETGNGCLQIVFHNDEVRLCFSFLKNTKTLSYTLSKEEFLNLK